MVSFDAGGRGHLPKFLCPFLKLEMWVLGWHLYGEPSSVPPFSQSTYGAEDVAHLMKISQYGNGRRPWGQTWGSLAHF
jgi:hypothetical protein